MSGSVGLLWRGSPIVICKVPCGIMQGCEDRTCHYPPSFRFVLSAVGLVNHRSLWMR